MEDFKKNDDGKLQWHLIPWEQLEDVVKVLMNGCQKYGESNWKKCDDFRRYEDALMRHVTSYIKGEKDDNGEGGDGLPHLAHAICNCLFLMYYDSVMKGQIEKYLEYRKLSENSEEWIKNKK